MSPRPNVPFRLKPLTEVNGNGVMEMWWKCGGNVV